MGFMIMGPRQITGWSPSTRNPMLINFTPWFDGGTIFSASLMVGRSCTPIISGMLGPYMSQSSKPTFIPRCCKAQARLTETVDFPTPPLQHLGMKVGLLDCDIY